MCNPQTSTRPKSLQTGRFPERFPYLYLITLSDLHQLACRAPVMLGRRKKSRGRGRGEKERRPPLPFACSPRATCKKVLTRQIDDRQIDFHDNSEQSMKHFLCVILGSGHYKYCAESFLFSLVNPSCTVSCTILFLSGKII